MLLDRHIDSQERIHQEPKKKESIKTHKTNNNRDFHLNI